MALNQTVIIQFHGFHEIHLIAFWAGARIFPDEPFIVGQVTGPVVLPNRRLANC